MADPIQVALAGELRPGQRKLAFVDGRVVVVFNVGGTYRAIDDSWVSGTVQGGGHLGLANDWVIVPEQPASWIAPVTYIGLVATVLFLPFISLAAAPAAAVDLMDAVLFTAVFFATMAAAPSHIVILLANRAGTINRPESRGNGARRPIRPPRECRAADMQALCPAPRRVIRRAPRPGIRTRAPRYSGHPGQ